jgi:hypothetical protein
MENARGHGAGVSNLTCDSVPGVDQMNIRQMNVPRTPGVGPMRAFRPNVNAGANTPNIGFGKLLNVFNAMPSGREHRKPQNRQRRHSQISTAIAAPSAAVR